MYINLDNITLKDARELEDLRESHNEILRQAKISGVVGRDEDFDLHLDYLIDTFSFLREKEYIKE